MSIWQSPTDIQTFLAKEIIHFVNRTELDMIRSLSVSAPLHKAKSLYNCKCDINTRVLQLCRDVLLSEWRDQSPFQ